MENLKSFEDMMNENESLNEAKDVHPAIKDTLKKFIKNNPGSSFKDAERHISKAIKGWKLSKEDFEKCKKECEPKDSK